MSRIFKMSARVLDHCVCGGVQSDCKRDRKRQDPAPNNSNSSLSQTCLLVSYMLRQWMNTMHGNESSSTSQHHHYHYHHRDSSSQNYTITTYEGRGDHTTFTTSVTIRVTPQNDYMESWSILWGCFVLASIVAAVQVHKEYKLLKQAASGQGVDPDQQSGGSDAEGVSAAHKTRGMFRRLLLVAMLSRVILMPVQIWAYPIWWQFVSDSLPEMIFASSWTLLVSFFVQLVGLAGGSGTIDTPVIVIQATAYVTYILLITLQIWNKIATILLYALLCCIYAALFGTVVYFGPVLVALMKPSLERSDGIAIRVLICTVACIMLFAANTVGYAFLVVHPPRYVYWWYKYGVRELLPAVIFLAIMHPSPPRAANHREDDDSTTPKIPRINSTSSANSGHNQRGETASLATKTVSYGATVDT
jgi:hypothetical protein